MRRPVYLCPATNRSIRKSFFMKKISLLPLCAFLLLLSCNDNKTNDAGTGDNKAIVDSLFQEVMKGHNIGMAKIHTLEKAEAEASRILDSISKLPAKAQEAAAPLKTRLESLDSELKSAIDAMNEWMAKFNYDSAKNDLDQRIKYLSDEKLRVNKVKEAILGSLQKADSLIQVNR